MSPRTWTSVLHCSKAVTLLIWLPQCWNSRVPSFSWQRNNGLQKITSTGKKSLETSVFKLSHTKVDFFLCDKLITKKFLPPVIIGSHTLLLLLLAKNFNTILKCNCEEELIDHSATIRTSTLITIVSSSLGQPEKAKKSSSDLSYFTFPYVGCKNIPGT